jgi:hypothetical protein
VTRTHIRPDKSSCSKRDVAWAVVYKAALDSIPALRRGVIEFLHGPGGAWTTTAIAEGVGYPTPTARRALEDLRAHQIANRKPQGEGKADLWSLSAFARERLDAARSVPEMSEDLNDESFSEMSGLPITHPHRVFDDFRKRFLKGAKREAEPSLVFVAAVFRKDPAREASAARTLKAEAAEALGVSVDHFERHILVELKVVYCGARRLYPVRELERWLTENATPVLPVTRTKCLDETRRDPGAV